MEAANASTGDDDEPWFPGPDAPYGPAASVFIVLVLLCVIVGTIVGNILVCVAVFLVRKLRRPCNYLLVSLAVSDLCVATLVMPMALLYEVLGRWSFGDVVCDLWVSFDVLSCTASILNLCMISVDRYYAITKPLEYGVKRTPRRMIACVSLVWLGAACISLPPLLILGNEHGPTDGSGPQQCFVYQNFGYQIYATLGSFYIPLTVMIVVYYKIFRAARKIVLEERRAQSHLETHSYLEINVRNGGGPPETKISSSAATATTPGRAHRHRASSVSTNTTEPAHETQEPDMEADMGNYGESLPDPQTDSGPKLVTNVTETPAVKKTSGKRSNTQLFQSTKRQRINDVTAAVKELRELNTALQNPTEEDECSLMGRTVAAQLRQLPKVLMLQANIKLQQVLLKYRLSGMSTYTPHLSTALPSEFHISPSGPFSQPSSLLSSSTHASPANSTHSHSQSHTSHSPVTFQQESAEQTQTGQTLHHTRDAISEALLTANLRASQFEDEVGEYNSFE